MSVFARRLPAVAVLACAVAAAAVAWNPTRVLGEECSGDYGTEVHFVDTPAEAAKLALKKEKLVFVLHVSGEFEDPRFTWNNAEALRVSALANREVGKYLNEHFVAAFQKVGTFRIVGNAKQGGNVASYFCAQDGRVLHVVAGPVNAATLLREAKWVVESVKKALAENKRSGKSFKAQFRELHAARLRREHGLAIEPVKFDAPTPGDNAALSYIDPTGKPLAPVLPPPPIEGPDVGFNASGQEAARKSAGARAIADRRGKRWVLGNQGRAHMLMAAHSMKKIQTIYGSVFEGILGEKVSTKPVQVTNPFPWHARGVKIPQAEIRQALLQLQVKELHQQLTPNVPPRLQR